MKPVMRFKKITRVFNRFLVFLLLSSWFSIRCIAQPEAALIFEHLNSRDGLSSDACTAIVCDQQGFIWIATTDGLNRYDGHEVKVFRHNPDDPSSICDNYINRLVVDRKGLLWVATRKGLSSYHPQNGAFSNYLVFDKSSSQPNENNWVSAVFCDRNNAIWFGSHLGLCKFDQQKRKITTYPIFKEMAGKGSISSIVEDRKKNLWITALNGVYFFNRQTGRFRHFKFDEPFAPGQQIPKSNLFIQAYIDSKEKLWFGNWGEGLLTLDTETGRFSGLKWDNKVSAKDYGSKNIVLAILEINSPHKNQEFWLATSHGLCRFNAQEKTFRFYQHSTENKRYGIAAFSCNALCDDKKGCLWIGTDRGLNRLDRYNQQIKTVFIDPFKDDPQRENNVVGFIEDITDTSGNTYWLGVWGHGLLKWNRNKNTYVLFEHQDDKKRGLTDNWVNEVARDPTGNIWVGSSSGIDILNPTSNRFIGHFDVNNGLPGNRVSALYFDSKGRAWISVAGEGVIIWNTETGRFEKRFRHEENDPNSLISNSVSTFFEDRNHNIWIIARYGGLHLIKNGTSNVIRYGQNLPKPIPNISLTAILEDARGILWLASEAGLIRLNPKSGQYKIYSQKEGLSNINTFTLLADNEGFIWITTRNGLFRFDPQKEVFKKYGTSEGLTDNLVNEAGFKTPTGDLLFANSNTINFFHPKSLKDNPNLPKPQLTGLQVLDKEKWLRKKQRYYEALQLNDWENIVRFEFSALNYTDPEQNKYAYYLEGFDKKWNYSGNLNSATYTNLNGGEYLLRVKASNNNGLWGKEELRIPITVIPPFWKTNWFFALVILLVAISAYGLYRYRVNQLLSLERVRLRIARDLHDDIGSVLSGINMFSEVAYRQSEEKLPETAKIVQLIGQRSKEMMEAMDDIVWSVNPKNDSLERLLIRMRQFAAELFESTGMGHEINFPENTSHIKLNMDTRRNLYLIFKEAVNNLTKHSGASQAWILLKIHGNMLHLSIADNGCGLTDNTRRNGNGLNNMAFRASAIKGELEISKRQEGGTSVLLQVNIA